MGFPTPENSSIVSSPLYKKAYEPYLLEIAKGSRAYLHEVFVSIQGEGLFAGEPTTFIRFQYCPFDCKWCDSKRTWAEPKNLFKERVKFESIEVPTRHVCITGGEPLSQFMALRYYVEQLKRKKLARGIRFGRSTFNSYHIVSVETSGYLPLPPGTWTNRVDSWVVDVKPPGATNRVANVLTTPRYDQLAKLRFQDQVKFVVVDETDLNFVVETMKLYPTPAQILISPANPTKEKGGIETATMDLDWHQAVIEFCIKHGYRFSPQLHKFVSVR